MKKETERVRPVRTLEELYELARGNEVLERLFTEMREYMFRYTETVLEFNEILTKGLSDEETNRAFQEMDATRTRVHNGLIDAVNIFSRALAKYDKDNSWVGTFQGARAAYGRFALSATAQAIIQHEATSASLTKEAA